MYFPLRFFRIAHSEIANSRVPRTNPAQNTYVRVALKFEITETYFTVKKTELSLAPCNVCKMTAIELMSFTGEYYHENIKKHGMFTRKNSMHIFLRNMPWPWCVCRTRPPYSEEYNTGILISGKLHIIIASDLTKTGRFLHVTPKQCEGGYFGCAFVLVN